MFPCDSSLWNTCVFSRMLFLLRFFRKTYRGVIPEVRIREKSRRGDLFQLVPIRVLHWEIYVNLPIHHSYVL